MEKHKKTKRKSAVDRIWNRLKLAWKALFSPEENEEKSIEVVKKDSSLFSLVQSRMNTMDQEILVNRIEKLERLLGHVLVRMNNLTEYQMATKEAMVSLATASEEMSHGLDMLLDAMTAPSSQPSQQQQPSSPSTAATKQSSSSIDSALKYPSIGAVGTKGKKSSDMN